MNWLSIILAATLFPALWGVPHAYASDSDVVINEIEANPAGEDRGAEEVELYNLGSDPIDIGGWTISTSAGTTATVTIEDGTVIQPNGYVIVGSDSQWIDNTDEALSLVNDGGDTVDTSITFSDEDNDANTWQRSPDGTDKWVFAAGTLGGTNVGSVSEPEPVPEPEPTPEPEPSNPLTPPQNGEQPASPLLTPAPSNQELKIIFIDVGEGSSTLIISPNGNAVLIDGGDAEHADRVLATLNDYDINGLMVVATHPHADHIGGLVEVLSSVEVEEVIDSGQVHNTQTFENFLNVIEAKQIALNSVFEGVTINPDPAVRLDILNPPQPLTSGLEDEDELLNENSVVIKLTFGAFKAIFAGDMGQINEARLANKVSDLDADVLLAGHHGSNTASTASFLGMVSPEVIIISAGANNSYGHPHPETLERISEAGTQHVFRTDQDGTIVLTTPGYHSYTIETEESGKTVVVPEFETAILVSGLGLMFLVAFFSRDRIWKSLKRA